MTIQKEAAHENWMAGLTLYSDEQFQITQRIFYFEVQPGH